MLSCSIDRFAKDQLSYSSFLICEINTSHKNPIRERNHGISTVLKMAFYRLQSPRAINISRVALGDQSEQGMENLRHRAIVVSCNVDGCCTSVVQDYVPVLEPKNGSRIRLFRRLMLRPLEAGKFDASVRTIGLLVAAYEVRVAFPRSVVTPGNPMSCEADPAIRIGPHNPSISGAHRFTTVVEEAGSAFHVKFHMDVLLSVRATACTTPNYAN